jgi:hypothetical protein
MINAVPLEAFLLSPKAVALYLEWFKVRKVLGSTLEQDIYDQCLLDKYHKQGLTAEILNCIRTKGIDPSQVYFPYHRENVSVVGGDDRQIKAVYTGSHYDLVEEITGVQPILLTRKEQTQSSIQFSVTFSR